MGGVDEDGTRSPAPGVALPDADDGLVLLGRFALRRRGVDLALPVTEQRLIALLALRGPLPRRQVSGVLWPDADDGRAAGGLRSLLWRVRQAADGVIATSGDALHLDPLLPSDLRRLQVLTTRGAPVPAEHVPQGELLPALDDEWVVSLRPRLLEAQVHLLLTSGEAFRAEGRFAAALSCAHAALGADSLRESAHRLVLEVHLDEGDLASAVRGYEAYAALLRSELGLRPSALMRSLLDR